MSSPDTAPPAVENVAPSSELVERLLDAAESRAPNAPPPADAGRAPTRAWSWLMRAWAASIPSATGFVIGDRPGGGGW
jgi:hypothetical protein